MTQDRQFLKRIEKEKAKYGYSPTLQKLWEIDYERVPVPIRQFVEDDYYLGSCTRDLSDRWKTELDIIFAPDSTISSLIFTGAIGTGKTTVATICLAYMAYLISCLRDPPTFYGLLPGSKIIFGCFNITLNKAEVGYDLFKQYIDSCSYFRELCPRRKRPDEPIAFPTKRLEYHVGSLSEHALGDNMLAFLIDEANFFKKTPDPTQKSRAHQLFSSAQTRLVSRFMRFGRVPGLAILVSSRKMQTSFVEEQLALVEKNQLVAKTTRIVSMSLWESKPSRIYTGKKFSVAIGDEKEPSRILEEDEFLPGHKIVEVPEEYRQQFESDIDDSIMNLAGISIVGQHSFITDRSSVRDCVDKTRQHPFKLQQLTDVSFDPKKRGRSVSDEIAHFLDIKRLFRVDSSQWVPRIRPQAIRFCHCDLGLTKDALGLSIGHVYYPEHDQYQVYIDLMLRILAKPGQEIDFEQIVKFLVFLKKHGYNFGAVTFDTFQSRMVIQQLAKVGFNAALMGITLDHYKTLRQMLFERRISYYEYPIVMEELVEIRRAEDPTMRPNHPTHLHDDVADSLAGVIAHCTNLSKIKPEKPVSSHREGIPLVG